MDIQIDHADLPCGDWLERAGFIATEASDKSMKLGRAQLQKQFRALLATDPI